MKTPVSLSDEGLLDYADRHLKYEIEMLIWTAAIMGSLGRVREEGLLAWACNNALVNSFAMHARNLIDFLYLRNSGKDRPTDIIVQDYIDQGTLSKHLPPITSCLEQAKVKSDKQAAHLTFDRIQYEKAGKEWKFAQIAADTMKAFRAIAPIFPKTRLSDSFRQFISQPDLLVPQVATSPVYSTEGRPTGISFCVNLSRTGEVICFIVSA